MKTRTFGRTGLQVSELVFGGGWVGGVLIHQDDDTRRRVLKRALDAGINWIDTAAMYGKGQSEQALGWLLKEVDAKPYLSTKVYLDTSDLTDMPGQIERSLDASLKRMNRDSVDLFILHNPVTAQGRDGAVTPQQVLRAGGALDGLRRVRDKGLTRFVGMTALGDADCCATVIGSGGFDAAQVYYNLLNPSAARVMPAAWQGHRFDGVIGACKAQGTAVMAIRILAAGVLASDERHGREVVITEGSDVAVEERRARAVLEALGDKYGSRAQTAVRFALSNPDIACAVVGLAEASHLEEALGAQALGPLPPDALQAMETLYAANFGM